MTASAPRPAATVMLIRDRQAGGLEVFLMRRHPKSAFMGGAHVFPGGKVDAADGGPEIAARLDLPEGDLPEGEHGAASRVAAIRETWEECGVLLVHGGPPDATLLEGPPDLARLLDGTALRLAGDALQYVACWVTPEQEPRRYDARFYLARAPAGQRAVHTDVETTSGGWFEPGEAVGAMHRGEVFLAPPTLRNLEILAEAADVDDAMARARTSPKPVVRPELRLEDGCAVILLPGDPELGPAEGPFVPGPTKMVLRAGRWIYPDRAA